ncbi:uncharacterized protein LOC122859530 [Aphidius gifuensis]|uniref:uncharacterized protein LOC122859530 n=1 Tax=Aphidius gifuensis TaxID=684658 RepID=UPI001CDC06B4|nr:uncharacterized protein LOC122859530 [Aphidius gifuensis]
MNAIVFLVVLLLIPYCIGTFDSDHENHHSYKDKNVNKLSSAESPLKNITKISLTRTSIFKLNGENEDESEPSVDTESDRHRFKDIEILERSRRHRKNMNRALMALLMAYKLKFAALIPTLIGGLILLLSTTSFAGFFFALFAAILGLRGQ